MNLRHIYIFLIILLSCAGKPETIEYSEKTGIPVTVLLPSGEKFKKLPESYLPTFFNLATVKGNKSPHSLFLILGDKKNKGAEVYCKAICLFSYTLDSLSYKYIVSVPTGIQNDYYGQDFSDFELYNGHLQSAIENWFMAQCPQDRCQEFKWDNTLKALIEIDNLLNAISLQ